MTKPYDFTVFIGRFQPFHHGHLKVVREGLNQAEKMIVLIGSAWEPRSPRNPWTHQEREEMIRRCLTHEENARLFCLPLMDVMYNDELWVRNVQSTVNGLVTAHHLFPHRPAKVALIGHRKDSTGFYLSLFPQWHSVSIDSVRDISATPLREAFFTDEPRRVVDELVSGEILPPPVADYLVSFAQNGSGYGQIHDEITFIKKYREAWKAAPYPPVFVTVDAVVIQSGHILLIERRASPGKGLWALPGGFVDQGERLLEACLRELREETKLKVPAPVLKGSIRQQGVYDAPYRSARGRTITHAFYIELAPDTALPKVKGGDDAKAARWVPLSELDPQVMFEDHYFIIQHMLGTG
ncbi:ADP-ribose pyrophosphatase [Leminorella grimontii]|uniref:ADP-ribose pyrophosphatase n=1 Tax=Leminorella grimontii TaxID=82981 RepID=A0AAV5N944_9GAMM|nr:bifunctional nicotinamide-nucleotide adenylyltransferase/Nudix hydroxylase [Leminorella grimontii]KFC93367.1 nicotinamide-nucleotide adenylyltransferase/ADP-ribose pyrophosphatase [Leminorella grimontii ATCC 33999 = DSM 5078]GKX57346.1 ADP-ribose pyrophosphatase [Leminorella grimontii]VFS54859.1 Bifunctional NMN adenylyltransferase/Nudix hydrolase [Leminorella grimontii]